MWLSEKKKNDGDLPPPVLKSYIPVIFYFGTKDYSNYYSEILPFRIFLKIDGANSLTCM